MHDLQQRGADKTSARVAKELDIDVLKFPADWAAYGLSAGPKRNQQMIDEGKPTHIIAFHNNIERSKGTKDMLKKGLISNIPCYLVKDRFNHFTSTYIDKVEQIEKK